MMLMLVIGGQVWSSVVNGVRCCSYLGTGNNGWWRLAVGQSHWNSMVVSSGWFVDVGD